MWCLIIIECTLSYNHISPNMVSQNYYYQTPHPQKPHPWTPESLRHPPHAHARTRRIQAPSDSEREASSSMCFGVCVCCFICVIVVYIICLKGILENRFLSLPAGENHRRSARQALLRCEIRSVWEVKDFHTTDTGTWKHLESTFKNTFLIVLLQSNIYTICLGLG